MLSAGALAAVLLAQPAPRRVDLLVTGGAVLTMDPAHRIIERGLVAIAGGRIVDVGPQSDLAARYTSARVIDATGRAVVPGLINLHTHSSMIFFRGLADDYSLATWGLALVGLHRDFDELPGFRLAADRLACLEMLRNGTTTFVEMYHHPELVASVASQAGMRALVTLRLPFAKDSFDRGKAEAEFDHLYRDWDGKDSLITVALAAHAPHTVPEAVLRFTADLARRRQAPPV